MSIADKIARAKEDYDAVYDRGWSKGNMAGISEGFEDGRKNGYDEGYGKGYEDGVAAGGGGDSGSYDQGFEDGKKAEYDAFWDAWQNKGARKQYYYAFYGTSFTHISPKYLVKPQTAYGLFTQSRSLETVDWDKFDLSAVDSLYTAFAFCDNLKSIDTDLGTTGSAATVFNSTFNGCLALERVKKITIPPQAALKNAFDRCESLVDITIAGTIGQTFDMHWSTKLSAASIESIISALSTEAENLSITLSETAVNKAFETSDGANDGADSEYWDDLVGSRYMWSIHLV